MNMKRHGFTVIELMVAMSLFTVVVGIASGVFVRSLRTQRAVAALMAANDNASFALEQMAREVRTGREFSGSGGALLFTNDRNERVSYAVREGRIERNGASITSAQVLVTHLSFDLAGAEVGDGRSTRVTIRLGVSARGKMESFVTRLQTTVSSRVLDG
jgi:prepilin-type N-terminal cleavage/methylation domain-containing protein